nr:phosphoenolpyruvate hydrolase family protein [Singulisphaera sp. GP187]
MNKLTRAEILKQMRKKVDAGLPIIGAGAGTGISAKAEEAGGADLIVVYNSGRFRMAGCGSLAGLLAYGNANQIVKEMAPEVLSAVKRTPVLAGVCGTDPFLLRTHFLKELIELGFAGIQNFPTVGLIDGHFRKNLEETGMSYMLEVECVAEAHAMGLLTTPYVFDAEQARWMTDAGADALIVHMGLTVERTAGTVTAKSLSQCVDEIQRISAAAKAHRSDILLLCHGGPIALPEDAQYVLDRCADLVGFYGASSMERLPTEAGITTQVRKFAALRPASSPGKPAPSGGLSVANGAHPHGENGFHKVGIESPAKVARIGDGKGH